MIGKSELTQALALIGAEAVGSLSRAIDSVPRYEYYQSRRGRYGRNLDRKCKLLRRLKTTC